MLIFNLEYIASKAALHCFLGFLSFEEANFGAIKANDTTDILLSKGLDFCFFPPKLHLNNIRAEFERVYSELKRFLSHKICWF